MTPISLDYDDGNVTKLRGISAKRRKTILIFTKVS